MSQYADRKKLETFLLNNLQVSAVLAKPIKEQRLAHNTRAAEYAKNRSEMAALTSGANQEFNKLFYDLDVAVDILIGLIVSPKGAVRPELIFGSDLEWISPAILGGISSKLPRYYNRTYKLSSGISKMLKKVLHTDGAVARVIIPESTLDRLVNAHNPLTVEMRTFGRDRIPLKGIMSSGKVMTVESADGSKLMDVSPELKEFGLTITDNFDLLGTPKLRKYITTKTTESYLSPYIHDIEAAWGSHYENDYVDIGAIKPTRKSIGVPLYLEVDTGAISPIHIPGDPSKHTGYLLLLDENGYVVSPNSMREEIGRMEQTLPTTPMGKSIVNMNAQGPSKYEKTGLDTDQLIDIFMAQINSMIAKMLDNGEQQRDLDFSNVNAIYSAVLARAMSNQRSRLLFLPNEMVAYYAFKYNDNGIGETLLSDLPTLSSMRASLLFSGLISEIKNNIPQTKVNITLDDNDPDPDSSIEMIQSNALERQANLSPLGIYNGSYNATDWTEWARRSGFSFQVEQHPLLPNTKVEYEDVTPQRIVPSDSPLYEKLRVQEIMAIGVTPEMVDNGFSSDFASTDQAKRIQLARRVTAYQLDLSEMLTSEVRKLALADGNVYGMIREQLDIAEIPADTLPPEYKSMYHKNKTVCLDKIAVEIIRNIRVELPNPDTDNIDGILASLQKYNDALELALDSWFNADFLGGSEEEQNLIANAPVIRAALKAHFMRQYMVKNGYLAQLADMVSFTKDGTPAIDLEEVMATHVKGLTSMAERYLKQFTPKTEDVPLDTEEVVPPQVEDEESTDDDVPGDEADKEEPIPEDGQESDPPNVDPDVEADAPAKQPMRKGGTSPQDDPDVKKASSPPDPDASKKAADTDGRIDLTRL